jgi:uncharacterized membrane protein YagU involved in acid resistance
MTLQRIRAGAVSGLAATVPMTMVMLATQRLLPREERYALPPERITADLLEKATSSGPADPAERKVLTVPMHFGFGMSNGVVYALTIARLPMPLPVTGALFAVMTWITSYQGWAPALRLHPPATREPAGRNGMMVLAHIAWGVSAGFVLGKLNRQCLPR